uniref:Uncharacterized protein n=1 Tax=Anopheles farauti TaxID=69004 RepID=A0A182R152_9DIPT
MLIHSAVMDKTAATAHPASAAGPKVSQIANLFQRKPVELAQDVQTRSEGPTTGSTVGGTAATHSPTATVVRTESHAARFNNARALFEKLGEGRVNRPPPFSIKMSHSSSKEDNLSDIGSGPDRSPSPKRKQLQHQPPSAISNGIGKLDSNRILNQSRLKSEKPEKPEKPERKFNSRELIEKQKNWTSHFSKTRTTKGAGGGDFNRCDIIRTVPGTGIIAGAGTNVAPVAPAAPTTNGNYSAIPNGSAKEQQHPYAAERNGHAPAISNHHRLPSPSEPPPSPPKRQTPPPPPPEKGPRTSGAANARQNSFPSPTKTPPAVPPHATDLSSLSPTKLSPEKLKPPPRQAEPPPSVATPHANLPPVAPVRSSTTVLTTVHHQQQSAVEHPAAAAPPEKAIRKKSLEGNLDERSAVAVVPTSNGAAPPGFKYPELGPLARRPSSEKDTGSGGLTSPAHAISSSPSPGASASSGPSSPIHTEDEKQENESTEKLLMKAGSSEREDSRAEDSPPAAGGAKTGEERNGE